VWHSTYKNGKFLTVDVNKTSQSKPLIQNILLVLAVFLIKNLDQTLAATVLNIYALNNINRTLYYYHADTSDK